MNYWPPPGFIDRPYTLSDWAEPEIRLASTNVALRMVGKGPGDQIYRDICWPGDRLEDQKLMEKAQSACALTAAGVMRCLGAEHELLEPPYRGRNDAMSRLEAVARDHKAWDGADSIPDVGEIVIVGTDVAKSNPKRDEILASWGSPGHAFIVFDKGIFEGKNFYHSVDGGRGKIREGRYDVIWKGSRLWLRNSFATRRVYGVVRVARLRLTRRFCFPPMPLESSTST
ncbi:MAG: hypothetical protein WC565_04220 [Parcubacteria group bacterium]